MTRIYPFKFLDSYSKDDTSLFFGRDEEINDLYQMIFQSNILMVYGASGTGKTSLIQCGLASRFQPHDWLALYIRRGSNLNDSVDKALAEAGGLPGAGLEKSFKTIYRSSFRPVYLIFDQFEELFILGTKDEQMKFIQTVKSILNIEQPVKMIFSIREEYVGRLYDFEKDVPQLMRKKLRVEPMDYGKVKEVITGAANVPGSIISLKAGEEDGIALSIFTKLGGKDRSDTIQLPYLQVFLDKVYKTTIGDKPQGSEAVFTKAIIDGMPPIGDILGDFLEGQVLVISETLKVDGTTVTAEQIWQILSPFATLQGTKSPKTLDDLIKALPKNTDAKIVEAVVLALVTGRILKDKNKDDIYELMHDSLAGKIASKRSNEDREKLEVTKIIEDRINQKPEDREFFSEKQLVRIDAVKNLILTPEQLRFIDDCRAAIKAQKEGRKRRLQVTFAVMAVAMLLMGVLTFWALEKRRQAQSMALSSQAYSEIYKNKDFTKGLRYAEYAFEKDADNPEALKALFQCIYQSTGARAELFYTHSLLNKYNIESAEFFPDGSRILAVLEDGTAVVWDINGDSMLYIIGVHRQLVINEHHAGENANPQDVFDYVSLSPDGKLIFTSFDVDSATVWNAENGHLLYKLPTQSDFIRRNMGRPDHYFFHSVLFSPDCSRMVTVRHCWSTMADDGNFYHEIAELWDTKTGTKIGSLAADSVSHLNDYKEFATNCFFAKFVDSGRKIVSVYGNMISVTDAKNGRALSVSKNEDIFFVRKGYYHFHTYPVISGTGDKIITTSQKGAVQIWDIASERKIVDLEGSNRDLKELCFSPGSGNIYGVYHDSITMVWDAITGRILNTFRTNNYDQYSRKIYSGAFSPDGKNLLVQRNADSVNLYRLEDSQVVLLQKTYNTIGSFSPDGKKIILGADNNSLDIFSAENGKKIAALSGNNAPLKSVNFSRDGRQLLTVSDDNTIKVWNTDVLSDSNYYCVYSKVTPRTYGDQSTLPVIGDGSAARERIFSGDSSRVLVSYSDKDYNINLVRIWDFRSKVLLGELPVHYGQPSWAQRCSALFSKGGEFLLIRTGDSTFVLWNVAKRKIVANFSSQPRSQYAFSSDAKWFVFNGTIYSTGSGTIVASLRSYPKIYSLEYTLFFSEDSKYVFATILTKDRIVNEVKAWERQTGKEIDSVKLPEEIANVILSDDGTKLLITSHKGKAWELIIKSWKLYKLGEYFSSSIFAAFSPDGKMAFTSDYKSTTVWNAENGAELGTIDGIINSKSAVSADSKFLATFDKTGVGLFHLEKMVMLANIPVTTENEYTHFYDTDYCQVWFSADGKKLIVQSGSKNASHVITTIIIDPSEIIRKMKNRTIDLSAQEKAKYGIAEKK